MVNCNPETVSTDYDTSDRLYFEPLTFEHVMEILRVEQENGTLHGVIVQFGGQTPLKLANALHDAGIPILGTTPDAIDLAEDRERFQQLVQRLGLKQPENAIATTDAQAKAAAETLGYPLVIRPSYVLGGRAMEIVRDTAQLDRYIRDAVVVSGDSPSCSTAISMARRRSMSTPSATARTSMSRASCSISRRRACIPATAPVRCPPHTLPTDIQDEIIRQTEALAKALNVVGLMNVQFAVKSRPGLETPAPGQGGLRGRAHDIYLIEVNPRASRTVPFVAKATDSAIASIAARLMAGEKLSDFPVAKPHAPVDPDTPIIPGDPMSLADFRQPWFSVKEAVLPFARFPGVDTLLGPEMRSTGEVMGWDRTFPGAFLKAQLGAGTTLPDAGTVFISIKDADKTPMLVETARMLTDLGLSLLATRGTAAFPRRARDRVGHGEQGL
jgi:carbamoyl-phosphate synthase large subunit